MSAAPIVHQKKRPSSASTISNSCSKSHSSQISTKKSKQLPGRSSVGGRASIHDSRTVSALGGRTSTARPPSATSLVGNLATNYKALQSEIKELREQHEVQKRAFKEAQRNANSAANDLSNSRADGEDRKNRLDEVVQVHAACQEIGGRVEANNEALAKQLTLASVDVECLQELTHRLALTKKSAFAKIQKHLSVLAKKNAVLDSKKRDDEVQFKIKDEELDSDTERKAKQLLDVKAHVLKIEADANHLSEELMKLDSEATRMQEQVTELNRKLEGVRGEEQKLKVETEDHKTDSSNCLAKLDKEASELKSELAKIKSVLSSLKTQDTSLTERLGLRIEIIENKQKVKSNNKVEYAGHLQSLNKKIGQLRKNNEVGEGELATLQLQIKDVHAKIQTVSSVQTAYEQELADIKEQTDHARAKRVALESDRDNKESLCRESANRTKASDLEAATKQAELDKRVSDAESRVKVLNARVKAVAEESDLKRTEKENLTGRIDNAKGVLATLSDTIKKQTERNTHGEAAAKKLLDDAQSQMKTSQSSLFEKREALQAHQKFIEKTQARVALLESAELKCLSDDLRAEFLPPSVMDVILNEQREIKEQHTAMITKEESALDAEIATLKQQLEQMRSSHVNFRANAEAKCAADEKKAGEAIVQAQAEITDAAARKKKAAEEAENLSEQVKQEQNAVVDLEAQVCAGEEEAKALQAAVDVLMKETDDIHGAIDARVKEKEEQEKEATRLKIALQEAEAERAAQALKDEQDKADAQAKAAVAPSTFVEDQSTAQPNGEAGVIGAVEIKADAETNAIRDTAGADAVSVASIAPEVEAKSKKAGAALVAAQKRKEKKGLAEAAKKRKKEEAEKKKRDARSAVAAAQAAAAIAAEAAARAEAAAKAEEDASAEEDEDGAENSLFHDEIFDACDDSMEKESRQHSRVSRGHQSRHRSKSPPHVIGQGDEDDEDEEYQVEKAKNFKNRAGPTSASHGGDQHIANDKKSEKKQRSTNKCNNPNKDQDVAMAGSALAKRLNSPTPLPTLVPLESDKHRTSNTKSTKTYSTSISHGKQSRRKSTEEKKRKTMTSGGDSRSFTNNDEKSEHKNSKAASGTATRIAPLPEWKPPSVSSSSSSKVGKSSKQKNTLGSSLPSSSSKRPTQKKKQKALKGNPSNASGTNESDWLFSENDFSF